jgi:hypothetical protein
MVRAQEVFSLASYSQQRRPSHDRKPRRRFSVSMSTAFVAEIVAEFPYDMPAKLQIGWAFW